MAALWGFERPQTKSDMRFFLAGYYQQFIPAISRVAGPLSKLTRCVPPTGVIWCPECEKAYQQLKVALARGPVLASTNYGREFIIQKYASVWCIRVCCTNVMQRDPRGWLHFSPGGCCLRKAGMQP